MTLPSVCYFCITINMAKSIIVTRKKKGRPSTGQDPVMTVRLPPDLTRRINEWAKANGEESRSEAMRKLLEHGLATPKPSRKPPSRRAKRGDPNDGAES
jgi:Ribbon-helix-helix protein, copG family